MSERRYFHGTDSVLVSGDVLQSGDECGRSNWPGSITSVVWMHDNPEAARRYGVNVYEVVPGEWVENFSEEAGHDDLSPEEVEFITPSARIVAVLGASA